jgi:hypothetical protein
LGNQEFETVKVDEEIEFEVIGSQFKQEDQSIVVVGKLLSKVAGPVQEPLLTPSETQSEEQTTAVTLPVEEGSEKKIIVTDEKSKKRRLKKTEPVPESKE